MGTNANTTEHDPGESLRYVFTVLVRCPACGSDRFRVYGHQPNADTKTQYARCRKCEHKFLIIHEDGFNSVES